MSGVCRQGDCPQPTNEKCQECRGYFCNEHLFPVEIDQGEQQTESRLICVSCLTKSFHEIQSQLRNLQLESDLHSKKYEVANMPGKCKHEKCLKPTSQKCSICSQYYCLEHLCELEVDDEYLSPIKQTTCTKCFISMFHDIESKLRNFKQMGLYALYSSVIDPIIAPRFDKTTISNLIKEMNVCHQYNNERIRQFPNRVNLHYATLLYGIELIRKYLYKGQLPDAIDLWRRYSSLVAAIEHILLN